MKKHYNFYIFLWLSLFFWSCQAEEDEFMFLSSPQLEIIESASEYEYWQSHSGASQNPFFEIIGAYIEGETLHITLELPSACEEHRFQLIWRGQAEVDSENPLLIRALLRQKPHEVTNCASFAALERVELSLNLSQLIGQTWDNRQLVIHLENLAIEQFVSPFIGGAKCYQKATVNLDPESESCPLKLRLDNGNTLNIIENENPNFTFYQNQSVRIDYSLVATQNDCGILDAELLRIVDICENKVEGEVLNLGEEGLLIRLSDGRLLESVSLPENQEIALGQKLRFAYLPSVKHHYQFTPINGELFCVELID